MAAELLACSGAGKDTRNKRGKGKEAKKRMNWKDHDKRIKHMQLRLGQRNAALEDNKKLQKEYDEINEAYLKRIEKQKKLEEVAKINAEKREIFADDFVKMAVGQEPKSEKKRNVYQEKLSQAKEAISKKTMCLISSGQRNKLLAYLQRTAGGI